MKKTKELTLTEYMNSEHNTDDLVKPSITKRIREQRSLPNVRKIKKVGHIYLVEVPVEK